MRVRACSIKWADRITVATEFHDQGFCVKALTAGGAWIQMFEVMRPGLPQFSQKTIIPLDLLDGCPSIYFQYNNNRDTRV